MTELVGHWEILNELLCEAERSETLATDDKAQTNLIYALGHPHHGYWHIAEEHRQELIRRLAPLIPRIARASNPIATLEAVFFLVSCQITDIEWLKRHEAPAILQRGQH